MAIIYGPLNPPNAATYAGNDGDIFVRTTGLNPQFRFSIGPPPVWTQIVPPETRADVVPRAGALNDRLAKNSASAWDLGWTNAAAGVVTQPFQVHPPGQQVWEILHQLGFQWVDVTVISPGHNDPTAPQNIIVPEIEYVSQMICRLTFVEPTAGTALVRR